jgi:hypothetical protein
MRPKDSYIFHYVKSLKLSYNFLKGTLKILNLWNYYFELHLVGKRDFGVCKNIYLQVY